MKKYASLLIFALLLPVFLANAASCGVAYTLIHGARMAPDIPKGFVSFEEHMQKDGFQDYVDFCVYVYPAGTDLFEKDESYHSLKSSQDLPEGKEAPDKVAALKALFESFEGFLSHDERKNAFDFDRSCITEDDLYRVKKTTADAKMPADPVTADPTPAFDGYSLWFFDKESSTLYYIHANT